MKRMLTQKELRNRYCWLMNKARHEGLTIKEKREFPRLSRAWGYLELKPRPAG